MSTWTMHSDHGPDPAPARTRGSGSSPWSTGSRLDGGSAPDDAAPRPSRRRTVLVTLGWWLHGAARVCLALALLAYGAAKVALMQFGQADMGDALIAYGQMSPMGLLWRMTGYSPLFQMLSGMAEAGAGAALLWRRTVPLGALLGFADMTFVFVLNLGYDVPVKQLSLALAVLSLIVLAPWIPRLWRAVLGQGAVGAAPWPRLLPWRRADRIVGAVAAVVAIVTAIGTMAVLPFVAPRPEENLAAPAGVWSVQQDARPAAAQLADDTRIQRIAFGQWEYDVRHSASIRRADGTVLTGRWARTGPTTIRVELWPLRDPGQARVAAEEATPLVLDLTVTERPDGTMRLQGSGEDLVVAPDPSGRVLFDRGFTWDPRPDDPFNR